MIDIDRLSKLRLHRRPIGQIAFANLVLSWDYLLPRRTEIIMEGLDNLPRDRTVFLAMNHTDRYNYWPAQYSMYRRGFPFTATWVKGKYYDHRPTAKFLDLMNNIPLPSRGYVLATDFRGHFKRPMADPEYRFLRNLVDGTVDPLGVDVGAQSPEVQAFIAQFGGTAVGFVGWFEARFAPLLDHVIRLNRQAICELGGNVLVFPQGTRSTRLARGHTGLVQVAQHLGAAIVPVGCNGSDKAYPTNRPLSKGGRIVYRFGQPLELNGPQLAPHRVTEAYAPLTRAAAETHGPKFRAATDVVMAHINALLDPEYQAGDSQTSDGVSGMDRFL